MGKASFFVAGAIRLRTGPAGMQAISTIHVSINSRASIPSSWYHASPNSNLKAGNKNAYNGHAGIVKGYVAVLLGYSDTKIYTIPIIYGILANALKTWREQGAIEGIQNHL